MSRFSCSTLLWTVAVVGAFFAGRASMIPKILTYKHEAAIYRLETDIRLSEVEFREFESQVQARTQSVPTVVNDNHSSGNGTCGRKTIAPCIWKHPVGE